MLTGYHWQLSLTIRFSGNSLCTFSQATLLFWESIPLLFLNSFKTFLFNHLSPSQKKKKKRQKTTTTKQQKNTHTPLKPSLNILGPPCPSCLPTLFHNFLGIPLVCTHPVLSFNSLLLDRSCFFYTEPNTKGYLSIKRLLSNMVI